MKKFIVDGNYKSYFASFGLSLQELLREAKLPDTLFSSAPVLMDQEEYGRFMDALEERNPDDSLLLKMAAGSGADSFSPPLLAAWCSEDGKSAMSRLASYKKLVGGLLYEIKEEPDRMHIYLRPREEGFSLPSFLVKGEFVFLTALLRHATKKDIHPISVSMPCEAKGSALSDFLRCPIRKEETCRISFYQRYLSVPFITRNDSLLAFFEPELQKRLADMEKDESMKSRVQSLLAELLPAGNGSMENTARRLGMTGRTLQRKLAAENTTFQEQLSSTREILAKHYLRNTSLTTMEIAYLLGYAETNSFLRAFAAWTGETAGSYRKNAGKSEGSEGSKGKVSSKGR